MAQRLHLGLTFRQAGLSFVTHDSNSGQDETQRKSMSRRLGIGADGFMVLRA